MSLATFTHSAVAILAGLLVWYFQEARLGADLADERLQAGQYREQITTERSAADKRVAKASASAADKYQGALNASLKKQAALQADADSARHERDSLRKQLSDAEQRFADASRAALVDYARTANQLLGKCSDRYTELAKRADGHAADAATCLAAWPSFTPVKE